MTSSALNLLKKSLVTVSLLSSLAIVSSETWFLSWLWLEMNLMVFAPLISKSVFKTAALKYFLIQASSSLFLILALLSPQLLLLACPALLLKLGAAPFHSWFISLVPALPPMEMFLLLTSQKLGPLILISNLQLSNSINLALSLLSSLIGAVGGVQQMSLSSILGYSSVSHLGWMFAATLWSKPLLLMYFFIYSFLTFIFIVEVFKTSPQTAPHLKKTSSIGVYVGLLSLAGFPMTAGFIPKWILMILLTPSFPILMLSLLTLSLVPLFFYSYLSLKEFLVNNSLFFIFSGWGQLNLLLGFLFSSLSLVVFTLL